MRLQGTILILLFAVFAFRAGAPAQITITAADASAIHAVGNVLTNHLDSLTTSVDIGSPGATFWDFSALNSHFVNTFTSVLPSSTPYYVSDFPTSNVVFSYRVVIDTDTADGWQYSTQNPGDYVLNGVANKLVLGSDTLVLKAIYSPTQLTLPLPVTFNHQWGSDFTITSTTLFNGVPVVTTVANHTETVVVDAYGPMTMPGGIVLQALRVKRDDRYTSPSPPFYVRTVSYSFLTESGASVDIVASDTAAPGSGIIQTDGVSWSGTNTVDVATDNPMPAHYSVSQNYPNPFNPSTRIRWQSPAGVRNTLRVYDLLGTEVATLVDEYKSAGTHEVTFDAANLPSGTYFYRLQAGAFVETRKMVFMK